MRLTLAAVGRAKAGPAQDLYGLYAERLTPRPFSRVTLKEVEDRRKMTPHLRKAREAELLLSAVPPDSVIIALDERGTALSSAGFADLLARRRDAGAQDLAFLIGGADGLAAAATGAADQVLSLGAMTWPHLLVRALLLEQLYRVHCIWTGHPYHRA